MLLTRPAYRLHNPQEEMSKKGFFEGNYRKVLKAVLGKGKTKLRPLGHRKETSPTSCIYYLNCEYTAQPN